MIFQVEHTQKIYLLKSKLNQLIKHGGGEFWEGGKYIVNYVNDFLEENIPAPSREQALATHLNKQFLIDVLTILEESEKAIKYYSNTHIAGKTWYHLCKKIQTQKIKIQQHLL